MPLKLAAIGALGHMLSPAARHLTAADPTPAHVCTVLDRGTPGRLKETRREAWKKHGATCVDSIKALLAPDDLDGLIICAGKNGDDIPLIEGALPILSQKGAFLLHCSTISPRCVQHTHALCAAHKVEYVNWPLTGGPKGAETAQMLILASGNPKLYERLLPLLNCLGQPKYFGDQLEQAAQIKLVGHTLVFSNLLGLCTATTCYTHLNQGPLISPEATEFFDFLNQGAGGSRQWEVALRPGLAADQWDTGFMVNHALIDALYTAQMLIDLKVSLFNLLPILLTASSLALLVKTWGDRWGTHQLVQLFQQLDTDQLNVWLEDTIDFKDPEHSLLNILATLPQALQETCRLDG
jgi:3-hydroxyisobutyrate dehydrogenase-like beta-hydroxyacid dehydrogenase